MITPINGDMLQVADQIESGSVDLLLTDPPYNISKNAARPVWIDPETGKNISNIHDQKFDDQFDEDWDSVSHEEFCEQLTQWSEVWYDKMRKGATFCVFISDRYVSELWHRMEAVGFEPKRIVTWKKPAAVPFNRSVNMVSGCEYALWGIKPGGKRTFNADSLPGSMVERYSTADKVSSILHRCIAQDPDCDLDKAFAKALIKAKETMDNIKRDGDLIQNVIPNTFNYSGGGKRIHPTQKPTEILKYFVTLCSDPGDLVLDTFAGSGSTGVACDELGRNCILIERDAKMFDKMSEQFVDNLSEFGIEIG